MEQQIEYEVEDDGKGWKYLIIALLIGVLVIAGANGYAYYKYVHGGEWTCIAEKCAEFATGDAWVKDNCKLDGNEMSCEFGYEGQDYKMPLSQINVSNMVSCKRYECSTKVYIKGVFDVTG